MAREKVVESKYKHAKSEAIARREKELRSDPYYDGAAKDISRNLKKRGIDVKSKDLLLRKDKDGVGWEAVCEKGTVKVHYAPRGKRGEWEVDKWIPAVVKAQA